jgi:hypothetical protein
MDEMGSNLENRDRGPQQRVEVLAVAQLDVTRVLAELAPEQVHAKDAVHRKGESR